jgi:hypothetical protein
MVHKETDNWHFDNNYFKSINTPSMVIFVIPVVATFFTGVIGGAVVYLTRTFNPHNGNT